MTDTDRRVAWGLAAAVLSAAALWFGTGLAPMWWLTWLAAWPVLAFGVRSPARRAAVAGMAAWAGGGLNIWSYYRATLGMPIAIVVAATVVPALVFAAFVALASVLARRGRPVAATFVLPAGWTAVEHVVSLVSPHGTFGSLAYSQLDCLPVVQVAAVAGPAGITFLLMLVPSALAIATLPAAGRARRPIAWATAATLALVVGAGAWRLSREDARATVTVGLAAVDRPEQPLAAATAEGRGLLAAYASAAHALAFRGAEVVVLPEIVLALADAEAPGFARAFADSTQAGAVVVVGTERRLGGRLANTAIALRAGGETAYAKQHLLQPFESRFTPGTDLALLATPAGRAGLAVCKDMDFPPLGRRYARRAASLLLVPAWDFTVDGWLHSRMAVLRGIEGGFAVARAARGGRLTLSDDRGRVVAEGSSVASEMTSVLGTVHVGPGGTPYSRYGDWLGWLSLGVLALVLDSWRRARR